jgi:hypothetical protein
MGSISSCTKMFDLAPEETLTRQQVYRNLYDADAAIIGLYGKFMSLAKQHVVLNELRADMLDISSGADEQLVQLNNHNPAANNSYADPRPYYEVILNCNDILKNFKIMLTDNKMKAEEYNQRTADVIALRTWVYLQVGIHFGQVPYITEPVENINDLTVLNSAPKMSLQNLVKELIKTMEAIPAVYLDPYPSTNTLVASAVDGYVLNKMFIHKQVLMGDLYLWDNQYLNAAKAYKEVMETATKLGYDINTGEIFLGLYKIKYAEANARDMTVAYISSRNDVFSLVDNNDIGWRSIFTRRNFDTGFNYEWIWALPFDANFQPQNPFVDLFLNKVQASEQAISMWNSQIQTNNFPFDARGKMTYKVINGNPIVMKYLYNYIDPTSLAAITTANVGKSNWFLYRAATLHLRYAEAANRDGRRKLAFALMNQGIGTTYNNSAISDKTNLMNTLFDVYPYNFDARNGDNPSFRASWYRNTGIRGRAYLQNTPVVGDSTIAIENSLIQEAGLELAYEGQRWGDLLRVALRRNDPNFIADKVYAKLRKANNPNAEAVKAKLMDKNNWFLPFKINN